MQSYADKTFTITAGAPNSAVADLQRDLRRLGYLAGGIDGAYQAGTARAVHALTLDLTSPASGSQALATYNKGRVAAATTTFSPAIAACMADLLADAVFPKVPQADDPVSANAQAIAALRNAPSTTAPTPFLLAIVRQESDSRHFNVPAPGGSDSYVIMGLDRNDKAAPDRITSRGYGLGQYTLFHHPPTAAETASLIVDVQGNASQAYAGLRDKFAHFILGPTDTADDRLAEHGHVPLRVCIYASTDSRFMRDCANCARNAGKLTISCAGPQPTPFYTSAPVGSTYAVTQYYPNTHYANVPDRKDFGCDWPYATRRYNGGGVNSYHYQTHILLNLASL